MAKKPTIDELCRWGHNDDLHTERVTHFACRLYDLVEDRLDPGAPPMGVLYAAGRLHDIGVGHEPDRHPDVAAEVLHERGVEDYGPGEIPRIAALIRLHANIMPSPETVPELAGLSDTRGILQLGAILRVADGFDHGHIQDLEIVDEDIRGRRLSLSVFSPLYPRNGARIRAKAALWRDVMPVDLAIRPVVWAPDRMPRCGLIRPGDTLHTALRRVLGLRMKRMLDRRPGRPEEFAKPRAAEAFLASVDRVLRAVGWWEAAAGEGAPAPCRELLQALRDRLAAGVSPGGDGVPADAKEAVTATKLWVRTAVADAVRDDPGRPLGELEPFLREAPEEDAPLLHCLRAACR